MWVKPQGTTSPESMNTYRKTLSPTSLNICGNHVNIYIYIYIYIFSIYKTFLKNVLQGLPITYQNKAKMPGKRRKCLVKCLSH